MPRDPRDTASMLTTRSGIAMYVGAVLGPGVLLSPRAGRRGGRPGLGARLGGAAGAVGPARHRRSPRSASASPRPAAPPPTRARRSARAPARVTGWWFLAGVVLGAPAVALIGGVYVADLLGVGRTGAVVAAAGMMAVVMGANAAGLRATARLQLGLAGLLAALVLVAIVTALPESRAEHWTPFAPHGWARSAPPRAC